MEDYAKKMRFSSSPVETIPVFSFKPYKPCNNISSPTNDQHHDQEQKDQNNCSNGRERLKRHREEVAGRVVVPDRWGKEDLMNDWVEHSSFDKLLAPKGIRSAREALIMEAQRRRQASATNSTSQRLVRIETIC